MLPNTIDLMATDSEVHVLVQSYDDGADASGWVGVSEERNTPAWNET